MTDHDCDDAPPSSSAVRVEALGWHGEARRALARGLGAIRATRAHEADAAAKLQAAALGIAAVIRRQIHAEDLKLAPILESLDAWGPQRLEMLESVHQRERSALSGALGTDAEPSLRATQLETSIREILRALRLEEKELLDPDLLDDSTIVNIRQGGS